MLVTISIPFYNNQETLLNAIRSVFAQTYTNWELILIDDGSSDSSLKIAQSVDDSRVRVISDKRNKGLAPRLNEIVETAKGKYFARLDADDLIHPDRLKKQVEILENNKTVDLVSTGMYIINNNQKVIGKMVVQESIKNVKNTILKDIIAHATITGRLNWFKKNPYNEKLKRAQDYELWFRTLDKTEVMILNECLYFCRDLDSFNLNKYIQNLKYSRMIIKQYCPEKFGWYRTNNLLVVSYFKEYVYRAFSAISKQNYLLEKRYTSLEQNELLSIEEALNRIFNTRVPGVNI